MKHMFPFLCIIFPLSLQHFLGARRGPKSVTNHILTYLILMSPL